MAQSANSAQFSADFETSSFSPFDLSTNAGQYRTNVETTSLPLLLPPSSNAGQFRTNVETSSLPLVETPCLPPSCSTGEFHTRFKTSSNNPEMFQTGFKTSLLCRAFPTNARQFHKPLEAIKMPTCMSPVHELLVFT